MTETAKKSASTKYPMIYLTDDLVGLSVRFAFSLDIRRQYAV